MTAKQKENGGLGPDSLSDSGSDSFSSAGLKEDPGMPWRCCSPTLRSLQSKERLDTQIF